MTKKDIVKAISDQINRPQLETKEIVQKTLNAIIETLLEKGRVELRNFGVFQVKKRKARKARNPKTNAEVAVGERLIVTFKPGKLMEQRVAELTDVPSGAEIEDDDSDETTQDGDGRLFGGES